MKNKKQDHIARRTFLHHSAKASVGVGAFTFVQADRAFTTEANSKIQMGIVGTGGRGQFDGRNLVKTQKVEIVALADYFDFQMEKPANSFGVEAEKCFDGLNGYKKLLALEEVDAVLLTAAPYFRPMQFEAAIKSNKHVFAEKPIAVDPWGCHKSFEAGKEAEKKELTVGAGLQTRYEPHYQKLAKAIQEGAIGRPLLGHSTRMGGDLWRRERPNHFTERDHQIRHWLYYTWASGDFIVEMHVHNLDVFNWFTGMIPLSAYGQGGRDVRLDVGDIYDHLQVLYEYPGDFHLSHTGSQIDKGYHGSVKHIIGTEGYFDSEQGLTSEKVEPLKPGNVGDATEIEMEQFVASVLGEIPTINNSEYVTTSTFTCILGRTAAYKKQKVTWEELWNSKQRIEMPV